MAKKSELATQQKTWYKKLKDSGFKDIEYAGGGIKASYSRAYGDKNTVVREAREEYYYMAYHFLHSHAFKSELEKVIWEYHTNGLSVREIAKVLTKAKIKKMGKDSVWYVVRRLDSVMRRLYLSV